MVISIFLAAILGVIDTKPAANPEGKLLTMEEANIVRSVYPQYGRIPFTPKEKTFFPMEDGVYMKSGDSTVTIARTQKPFSFGTSVSRNEFGINGGIFPSPKESKVAFYYKDESEVTVFPLLDITSRTGSLKAIPYPMNGMSSEKVQLCVYDVESAQTIMLKVTDFEEDRYLTAVSWKGEDEILVQVLDRSQHHMHLNLYNANNGVLKKTVLTEENDAWVEPYEPLHFLNQNIFLYSTDNRDGYKSLYLADLDGNLKRITKANADISFLTYRDGYIYYNSAEVSPAENHLFRVKVMLSKNANSCKLKTPERLTKKRGWHNITIAEDGYYDRYSCFSNPGWTKKFNFNGSLAEVITECTNPLKDYAQCEIEFGSVKSADGKFDNYYRLIKPLGFDPEQKYPLIVYVYGGPHSQMVRDSWLGNIRMWEMLMAQQGYVVYVQDNRGTSNHGAEYEKAINRCCGRAEMEDQMVGIRALLDEPWVDAERVGVHGWSYGGFMTLSLATTYPEVFKVAVAGGPVIDWKWYEIMYGERYMDTEATNPEGFEQTSLIGKAANLKAKTLICQGAIDDTVVWEHSLSFVQKCIDLGIQIDYFPFPKAYHNMAGRERVYLYQKITDYFTTNL